MDRVSAIKIYYIIIIIINSRIQDSGISLVNGIVKSSVPLFSTIWVWWSDILNTYCYNNYSCV